MAIFVFFACRIMFIIRQQYIVIIKDALGDNDRLMILYQIDVLLQAAPEVPNDFFTWLLACDSDPFLLKVSNFFFNESFHTVCFYVFMFNDIIINILNDKSTIYVKMSCKIWQKKFSDYNCFVWFIFNLKKNEKSYQQSSSSW